MFIMKDSRTPIDKGPHTIGLTGSFFKAADSDEVGRDSDLMPDSLGFVSLGRVDHPNALVRGRA